VAIAALTVMDLDSVPEFESQLLTIAIAVSLYLTTKAELIPFWILDFGF
jgi:hypothetical protein